MFLSLIKNSITDAISFGLAIRLRGISPLIDSKTDGATFSLSIGVSTMLGKMVLINTVSFAHSIANCLTKPLKPAFVTVYSKPDN